jgi:hypothetical protein
MATMTKTEPAEPFGRWLIAQNDRGDWIDNLAAAARADRAKPHMDENTDGIMDA